MPLYTVECANKETGESASLEIHAASSGAAEAEAIERGFLVSRSYVQHADAHPLTEKINELRLAVNSLQIDMTAIRNSKLIVTPVATIGWGVVRGWWLIICIIFLVIVAPWVILAIFGLLTLPFSNMNNPNTPTKNPGLYAPQPPTSTPAKPTP